MSFLQRIAVTETPHLFYHHLFLIAERDGEQVAGLSGYDPVAYGMEVFYRVVPAVCEEIGWTNEDLRAASRRMSSYAACMPEEVPGIWFVESVAAMPPARRQGVMNRLLAEILAKGRTGGTGKARSASWPGTPPPGWPMKKRAFVLSMRNAILHSRRHTAMMASPA